MHNLSCENEFYLHENENHFHIKGWALNLILIRRPGGTRKWPIHGTVEPLFRRHTRDQGKCPLNRGVPSTEVTDTNTIQWILHSGDNLRTRTEVPWIEVTDKKITRSCFWGSGGNNVWLEWSCPLNKGIQKRGFIVKWQRNIRFSLKMQIFLFPQIRLDNSVGSRTAPIPQGHGFESPSSLFFPVFLRPSPNSEIFEISYF